jgi:DeoR/GlpR family transcriptional regulator of sugar metabolism
MIQDLLLIDITKKCFSTYSSRLIFTLISSRDFCTRNEIITWTGFSNITISRYLQEFSRSGLIGNAPGIVFLSDLGKEVFDLLGDLFQKEIELAERILHPE